MHLFDLWLEKVYCLWETWLKQAHLFFKILFLFGAYLTHTHTHTLDLLYLYWGQPFLLNDYFFEIYSNFARRSRIRQPLARKGRIRDLLVRVGGARTGGRTLEAPLFGCCLVRSGGPQAVASIW